MRKLWLEIPEISSAISLSGDANVNGASLASADYLRILRLDNGIKATELSGFGYEANTSASYVDPFGYVETRNEPAQVSVAGVLNFLSSDELDAYARFDAFVRIVEGRTVRLRYDPFGGAYANAYLLDGGITKLLKGEKNASRLACGFEFRGGERFYKIASKAESTVAASTAYNVTPTSGELSNYRNAFTYTIKLNAAPSTIFAAHIYHNTSGFPVAQLEINETLAKDDVIVWSSDPENPRVTVNGNDQIIAGKVRLDKKLFSSVAGSDLRYACSTAATKVTCEYKAYHWSV